MRYFYWVLIIIVGIAMVYIPKINFSVTISLGVVVLVLGVFGLARDLFHRRY
ncbi:MAG: hypothetical protein WC827_02505 [Candidatus Paceibacterota bacterium]|jgi:uncharacterized membrane protein HdeD (DUF308 family)